MWVPHLGPLNQVWPTEFYTIVITPERDTIALVDPEIYKMNHTDTVSLTTDNMGKARLLLGYKKEGNVMVSEAMVELDDKILYMNSPSQEEFTVTGSGLYMAMRYNEKKHGRITETLNSARRKAESQTLAMNGQ